MQVPRWVTFRPGNGAVMGMGVRGGVLAVTLLGLTATGLCVESCQDESTVDEGILLITGGIVTLASMLVDVWTAPASARRTNARGVRQISVAPAWLPATRTAGLRVQIRH